MNPINWTKKLLLNLFGPARLDDEHDPIVQLQKEHGEPTDEDGTHAGG